MSGDKRMPITLLTGFLGSGKTTVLNALLRHPDFGRTAVIVNEFGEIGLDHELVVSSSDSLVLLESGCMCCALRGDLLETLLDLAERREAGELFFDRVAIETSGLADPAPILHTLLTDPTLAMDFNLNGVVTTVDAATAVQTLARHEEARRQAGLADLILLTKTDLPEACEAAVRGALSDLNASAPVVTVTDGRIDPAVLADLGHFDLEMRADRVAAWIGDAPVPSGDGLGSLDHLDSIRSISWEIETPVSASQFDFWMDLLMAQKGEDILRLKALIHLTDVPYPFVVHGVQHIFHPPVLLKDWEGEDRRSKFVMIVRDFTDPELREMFESLQSLAVTDHELPYGYLSAEVSG